MRQNLSTIAGPLLDLKLEPFNIHDRSPAIDDPNTWVRLEQGNLLFQFCRQPEVIRIEKRDQWTAAQANPRILRLWLTGVGEAMILHTGIVQKRPYHLRGVVGRTVIDDEHFKV